MQPARAQQSFETGSKPREALVAIGIAARQAPKPAPEPKANTDYARKIWRESVDAKGSVVETYLASRGLPLDEDEDLTPDGKKIDRQMLGPAKRAAIKIDPDADVTKGLCIGEGLETCLSGRLMGLRPVWALGSAGAIAAFPALPGIDGLHIFGENDKSGANERAVKECSQRWLSTGREVFVAWTKTGDLNDEWRRPNE